jgi:hypothetical protein
VDADQEDDVPEVGVAPGGELQLDQLGQGQYLHLLDRLAGLVRIRE